MHRTLFGLIFVSLIGFGLDAGAQAPMPTSANGATVAAADEAELSDLIKTLESETARKKLISQLNALMAVKKSATQKKPDRTIGTRILDMVSQRIDSISADFVAGTRALMDVPNVYDWVVRQLSDAAQRAWWIEIS